MEETRTPTLILASTSPRRKELLASLQLPFEVVPSHADESVQAGWSPEKIVETLALRKADAVAQAVREQYDNALIIGSDTIVVLDGKVLGKPDNVEDAVRMITSLQGRTHRVFTGVACIHTGNDGQRVGFRETAVTMKPLDAKTIAAYVETGEPADKAGAYAIQGLGATLIEGIQGCYFNVVGLPLSLLSDMLSGFGIRVLRP
ncbi:Maf family protein [Paenibacillus sp. P96]|uniref:dTTP/UTP pyrophosphatase n=1 Tax=Paenibacillus zeirhizosphaerae TaxID=2987519 RepID=A0ABT9FMA9_9BACL|nr:Maf family protein [Paenibacillus sp. P96]MDP4095666.1 Maf family protein [Paenibacillus sp. P96]